MKPTILLICMSFLFGYSFSQAKTPGNSRATPISFYVGLGVAVNSFDVTGSENYNEVKIDHTVPVSPAVVVGAKLYTDNKALRFFLAPKISIYSFSAKGEADLMSGISPYHHSSSYKAKVVIASSVSLGYHLVNQSNLKWHLSGGIGFDFLINSREVQTTTYQSAPPKIIDKETLPIVFVLSLGTGVDIGKNLGIWLSYQPPADITKYTQKSSKLSSLQAGVSWTLSKRK